MLRTNFRRFRDRVGINVAELDPLTTNSSFVHRKPVKRDRRVRLIRLRTETSGNDATILHLRRRSEIENSKLH